MVAMTPLIAIQILGVIYKIGISKAKGITLSREEIIDMQLETPIGEFEDENEEAQIISLNDEITIDDEIIDFD
jgi:hypothetical protein